MGATASRSDRGTALIGTLIGFAIFLVLLLFCTQELVHLYATSLVTSAATTAADTVAEAGGASGAVPGAEAAAGADLGGWGASQARFDWLALGPDFVRVRVTAESPALAPVPGLSRTIVRTVTVRTEMFRATP